MPNENYFNYVGLYIIIAYYIQIGTMGTKILYNAYY